MLNIAIVSHGFREGCESHKQDGETLSAQRRCCRACQRLAILPWPSDLHDIIGEQTIRHPIGSFAAAHIADAFCAPPKTRGHARA
jgi:hypothetical protein